MVSQLDEQKEHQRIDKNSFPYQEPTQSTKSDRFPDLLELLENIFIMSIFSLYNISISLVHFN